MPAVALLGSICSGHGSFPPRPNSEASPDVFVEGRAVHRQGDNWQPHGSPSPSPPHGGVLASGSSTVFINGKQCARIADPVSCGSVVASNVASTVFAGG